MEKLSVMGLSLPLIGLAITVGIAAPVWGQQPKTTIRIVAENRVKPDRVGDYEAAIKQYNEGLKKMNWTHARYVWSAATGPAQYALVRSAEKWADLDSPGPNRDNAQLTGIGDRIRNCLESSQLLYETVLTDLSLPRAAEPPKFIRVAVTKVVPGKMNDYLAVLKDEMLPAQKKAGTKSYSVARVRFGMPTDRVISATGLNAWADLDGENLLRKAMGAEAYEKMTQKLGSMTAEREINVLRYRPELSYIPGAGGSGTESTPAQR